MVRGSQEGEEEMSSAIGAGGSHYITDRMSMSQHGHTAKLPLCGCGIVLSLLIQERIGCEWAEYICVLSPL